MLKKLLLVFVSLALVISVLTGVKYLAAELATVGKNYQKSTETSDEEIATHEQESTTEETTTQEPTTEIVTNKETPTSFSTSAKPTLTNKVTTTKKITTTKRVTTTRVTTTRPTITVKPTTTRSTTTTAQSNGTGRVTGFETEMLSKLNQYRANVGVGALSITTELNNVAAARAKEIVERFSHTRPNGSRCFTILDEYSITYRAAGENIARGQDDVSDVMVDWYNSKDHRENMLASKYGHAGFGCYRSSSGELHWVQIFTD